MLKDEDKNRIIKVLVDRVGQFNCPICHKGQFSIVDGYSSHALGDDYRSVNLGGKIIPFVMLACNNCGFISHHALGSLDLLDRIDSDNK